MNQLKSSPGDNFDVLKELEEPIQGGDADEAQSKGRAGNYDISDDEGSSDSDNNKQPVDLDEAAQAISFPVPL